MPQPARCKPVWFRMPDGLLPAWYVEVQVADATGEAPHYFAYVISAQTGETLFRHSQEADAQAFSYRVWAEPSWRYLPYPGPQGRNGSPHPTGQPDGYQAPFVAPNLITLVSTNFLETRGCRTMQATRPGTTSKHSPISCRRTATTLATFAPTFRWQTR